MGNWGSMVQIRDAIFVDISNVNSDRRSLLLEYNLCYNVQKVHGFMDPTGCRKSDNLVAIYPICLSNQWIFVTRGPPFVSEH